MVNVIKEVVGRPDLKRVARDSDRDGVMDILDCQPHNKNKQGVIHKIGAAVVRKLGSEERAERIEARGREVDIERQEAREEKKEFRATERESFKKERVVVARKAGIARARRPTGFAGFMAGVQTFSAGVSKLSAATAPRRTVRRVVRRKAVKGKRKAKVIKRVTRHAPRRTVRRVVRRKARVIKGVTRRAEPKRQSMLDFKF